MSLGDDLEGLDSRPEHVQKAATRRCTLTSDHADVETGPLDSPLETAADWEGVLRMFGLDPEEFEIVDDTVRMSRWQQSRRTESGDRDMVWLQSYSARFRRITDRLPRADLDALMERVRAWKPKPSKAPVTDGTGSTFYVGWADWQVGKNDLAALTDRVLASLEATVQRIRELRRSGRVLTQLCIANMGDPMEGCYGHYESQPHTVKANKRAQLNLVLDLWTTGLRTLAPLFEDVLFVSVLSNHGEWTRATAGGRAVTGDSDSADAFLAETLQRVLEQRSDMSHVRFLIPHDEMSVMAELSGVWTAFAHGHKAPGSAQELQWLRGQAIRLFHEHGVFPRNWMTAHRHHLRVDDFGAFTRFQHPALEGAGEKQTDASKWYTDTSGLWSTHGTLSVVIGQHDIRGWSDLALLA